MYRYIAYFTDAPDLVATLKTHPSHMYAAPSYLAIYLPSIDRAVMVPCNTEGRDSDECEVILRDALASLN